MKITKRLEKIEQATSSTPHPLTTYHCIINGEPQIMTLLDFIIATEIEGKTGTRGRIAGEIPITPPAPGELERIFDAIAREYNSPESEAKRKAAYEELQRIGALRQQAFYEGRSMDEYPLPWQRGDMEA